MADSSFQIADKTALDDSLKKLCKSNVSAEAHFGKQLNLQVAIKSRHSKRADLDTGSERILRACVFEVFDILRRHCEEPEMLVHMCFVTRNDIASCLENRLTPAKKLRAWDGFDELKPQTNYKNDWWCI